VAIAGVSEILSRKNAGYVWLVGTEGIMKEQVGFMRCIRSLLAHIYGADPWNELVTSVSANNTVSFRWMTRWLGFEHTRTMDNPEEPKVAFHELIHTRKQL